MTVTRIPSLARQLVLAVAAVSLLAACGSSTATSSASASASASVAPTPTPIPIPSYSLGPAPADCPTKAPSPMAADQTATVTMTTALGTIVIKVEGKLAPNAAGDFVALARCGYYDNVIFHRVPQDLKVIQAGDGQYARLPDLDPTKMGQGGPGYTITDDKVTTKYTRGTVAMARTSAANSGGSQFFIVLNDSAQAALGASGANNYAIFGSVSSGMDVADKIGQIKVGGSNNDMAIQAVPILSTAVAQP